MSVCFPSAEIFTRVLGVLRPYWRRQRGSLGPPQVLQTLMGMSVLGTNAYQRTLRELKTKTIDVLGREVRAPSSQAFSQARRKLSAERCRAAVTEVRQLCTTARTHASLGYGGFRLLAIDGTKLALPAYRVFREHFGCPAQSPRGPQASFTLLWDVGANQPVDWEVGPYRVCERVHALTFLAKLDPTDLVLGDRNFASRRLLFTLHACKANWLMRVRSAGSGTLAEVVEFVASGKAELGVTLMERNHHGGPDPESPRVEARLLRMDLHDGTVAVFITSLLDPLRHPAPALIELYAARWRIETAFRELKIWHGLERFHARYVDGIAQEVAALMLFQLLSSELEAQARIHPLSSIPPVEAAGLPAQVRKPTLRFNRRIVADGAVDLLYAAAWGPERLRIVFQDSLYHIWRTRQMVKPRRSFLRERKSPARGWKPEGGAGLGLS
jgi:hypothetical protein